MTRLGGLSTEGAVLPHRPVDVPRAFPKPLVAAINGACAGVGLVQALFCHVRFAADTARFSTAFARRGLVAEYGIAWTLPRLVGLENALDLLLSGRTFDAAEAKELGVVSRVVPRDDVLAAAQDYARDVALHCAPSAVAVIAAQVRDAGESDYAAALERAYLETDKRIGSADLREGVASWLEKRPPQFPALSCGACLMYRVAVVGAGPSGLYAAAALLSSDVPVSVDVLDRLPAPYGLVRYGVAPGPREDEVGDPGAAAPVRPRGARVPRRREHRGRRAPARCPARARARRDPRDRQLCRPGARRPG